MFTFRMAREVKQAIDAQNAGMNHVANLFNTLIFNTNCIVRSSFF